MDKYRRHIFYVPVLFCASGLLFLKSVVYARLLSVEAFGGLNQALLIASTFTNFAGAGLPLLGHKLLPQFYVRGESELADSLIASAIMAFGSLTFVAAVVIGVAVVAGWLTNAATWYATLLVSVAQSIFFMRLIDCKSKLRFMDHALLSVSRAVLLLIAGAGVALATRSVAPTLATEGLVTLCMALPLISGPRGSLIVRKAITLDIQQRQWLAETVPAALRLLWLNGTITLLYSIDRWTGVALLTKQQYGIYALGFVVVLVFETLQTVVNVAAYPLMGRLIARELHHRAFNLATTGTVVVVALTVVCYAPFVYFLKYLVRDFLPAYSGATVVIELSVIAGAFRLADFYSSFAILRNQERRLAWAFGVLLALVAIGLWVASSILHVKFDPNRMAYVTVVIAACAFVLNLGIATYARQAHTRVFTT
jgi:O-antigen/teichoic acid export membrane protein